MILAWGVYLVGVILTLIGISRHTHTMLFIFPGVAGIAGGIMLIFRGIQLQELTGRKKKVQVLTTFGSVLFFLCFPGFLAAGKGSPLLAVFFYGALIGVVLYIAALFVYIAGLIVKHKIEAIITRVEEIGKSELEKTNQAVAEKNVLFSMEASNSIAEAVIVNLGVIIVAAVLLFILLLVRTIFSLGLFIAGVIVIALYLVIDRLVWEKNGVRLVEIDPEGINFYRGKEKKLVRIDAGQITEINVFGKLNRRVVNIMLGGSVSRVMPGVTLFSGPRIRITNDLFNDKEFSEFIERIRSFKSRVA